MLSDWHSALPPVIGEEPSKAPTGRTGTEGHPCNNSRISGSTASTIEPRGARSYLGGATERNAARNVFLATPILRAIALTPNPSALCSRRISAQSSTSINLQSSWPASDQDRTPGTISGRPNQETGQNSGGDKGSVFTRWRHQEAFHGVPVGAGSVRCQPHQYRAVKARFFD
jgi:hypothetical protein